ncbi:MAG: hypothetical protein ABIF11_00685 [Nitrospirota bacterium]
MIEQEVKKIKENIQQAIETFANTDAATASEKLLHTLGYKSTKKANVNLDSLKKRASERNLSDVSYPLWDEWKNAKLIFQYSDDEVKKQSSLFEVGYNDTMQSYLFFAVELKDKEYSRSQISKITRFINRLYDIPVMLFFRYGNLLTVSVINRRPDKKDTSKDVLEKVTLIKDIRIFPAGVGKECISPAGGDVHRTGVACPPPAGGRGVENEVGPHRAHIEILFDLSFNELKNKYSFTNFVELHNAWQKTLDTKLLNKKFFEELSNWYFWAQRYVEFPKDKKLTDEKNIQNNLIRLITRLIFVWFLKEKNLVPENLFEKSFVKELLKSFDSENGHPPPTPASGGQTKTYFTAILQNLFFATLNQKMNERVFAEDHHGFYKKDHGIKNEYRYPEQFSITKDEVIKLFKDIPFLNGGLFDCLDKENEETGKVEYIDGFSRNDKKTPFVPDLLFFGKERTIDLSEEYGCKRNKEKCRGLLEIFNDYKFTIEENTPIEEEIALDPELLGKVFENLLAYYNPETKTTARKQTGSFYTPREIVNYMVDESLLAYLKQNLEEAGISDTEGTIKDLLSYSENPLSFNEKETQSLIAAIDNCKILDPACGSGAFPMGMLHKLVHILHKIDPRNELWKQKQIDKASQIDDPYIKENAIADIESAFENNEPDYGRKLYLIETCIYGVDIQPIAVQIAKLRFFISLVVDQKKQANKDNFGIRSLPNLETKFVAANTLIGLEKPKTQRNLFENPEIIILEGKLKELRHRYFSAKTRKEKMAFQKEDKTLRQEIARLLVNDNWAPESAKQIAAFDLYDQNASSPFFDPEWMFGLKANKPDEGVFDVVIANPPYGNLLKSQERKSMENTYSYSTFSDISSPFIEKSFNLLKNQGNLVFIITYAITFSKDFSKSRELIAKGFGGNYIYTFDRDKCRIFESMTQTVSIIKCFNKNSPNKKGIFTSRMFRETPDIYKIEVTNCNKFLLPRLSGYNQKHRLPKIGEKVNRRILEKLLKFNDIVGTIIKSSGSKIWIRTSGNYWYNAFDKKPYNSVEISPLYVDNNYSNFLIVLMNTSLFYFWFRIYGDGRHMNMDILESFPLPSRETILKYNILLNKMKERFMIKLFSVFDKERNRFITSSIKSEIDLLDLILCKYFYDLNYEEIKHVLDYDLEIRGGNKLQQPFIALVDKILAITKDDDYLTNPTKQSKVKEYERQIDQIVYELYGLTEDEIKIIEQFGAKGK